MDLGCLNTLPGAGGFEVERSFLKESCVDMIMIRGHWVGETEGVLTWSMADAPNAMEAATVVATAV